jgi:hypothetical protein
MCYKSPWGRGTGKAPSVHSRRRAWRRPVDIKPGRNYPRAPPPDQRSDRPATQDCSVTDITNASHKRPLVWWKPAQPPVEDAGAPALLPLAKIATFSERRSADVKIHRINSNRNCVIASIALSQESPIQSQPSEQQTERPLESQKPPDNQQETTTPTLPTIATPESVEGRHDTVTERSKSGGEKSDWLEKFFNDIKITDLLLVIFTAALAVYTGRLWYATAGLWEAAKEQSRDMKASIAVAAKSAEASLSAAETARLSIEGDRAWITWDNYTFADVINSALEGNIIKNGYGIAVTWKNSGRTLALNVSCVNKKSLINPGDAIPTFIVDKNDRATEPSSRGVGADIGGYLIPMDDIEADDFRNHRRRVIFYSRVTYTDIFYLNTTRMSEACFELIFAGGTITYNSGRAVPVSMRLVGPQNSSS